MGTADNTNVKNAHLKPLNSLYSVGTLFRKELLRKIMIEHNSMVSKLRKSTINF